MALALGPLDRFLSGDRYLVTLISTNSSSPVERQLVLFRLARMGIDKFYAIASECPHAGGPMEKAEVIVQDRQEPEVDDIEDLYESVVAVCPWHSYDFNLVTGESSTGFHACTWTVTVEEDNQGRRTVYMRGTEDPGIWQVKAIDGVSEAFAESSIAHSSTTLPDEQQRPQNLTDWACLILNTADPDQKVNLTREAVRLLRDGSFSYPDGIIGKQTPPDKPPRLPPRADVRHAKLGKAGSQKSMLSYLHAVTAIEQWAIDLAWDLIARFARPFGSAAGDEPMPLSFFEDWATIAEEEAKHFTLLRARLEAKGVSYGTFVTHDGLWDSAHATRNDIKARLSIVCLVHEARGLDVNPSQIMKFKALGDEDSVAAMTVVHADEISHVAAGHRYLTYVCEKQGLDPVQVFRESVREHFASKLKGPFNREDRLKAGMKEDWYAEW